MVGLLVAMAGVTGQVVAFDYFFGGPDPSSAAQSACNAIHADPGTGSVRTWATGRLAAGDSKDQVSQDLTHAEKVCPEFAQMIQLAEAGY